MVVRQLAESRMSKKKTKTKDQDQRPKTKQAVLLDLGEI